MSTGLGHERYVAHGSDLGAGVTAWLARDHPDAVRAIHLATPGLAPAPAPRTAAEEGYALAVGAWTAEEGGYAHVHATKPSTLGSALADSPASLAAWIGEKIVAWSSTRPDGSPAFDRELLLCHADALLGDRHDRHLTAPVLGLRPQPRCGAAARRPVTGSDRGEHLRRRAHPLPKGSARTRPALLHAHELGRAPGRRALPRGGRARLLARAPRRVPLGAIAGDNPPSAWVRSAVWVGARPL